MDFIFVSKFSIVNTFFFFRFYTCVRAIYVVMKATRACSPQILCHDAETRIHVQNVSVCDRTFTYMQSDAIKTVIEILQMYVYKQPPLFRRV